MKIILFGSNGMLGNYINIILKNNFNIKCIDRKDFDVSTDKWEKLCNIIYECQPSVNDVIINCIGVIPQKYNSDNLKNYIKVNSVFPHKLEEISILYKCKFIHITTDCVFNGSTGLYLPTSMHDSCDIYGISKSLGEPEKSTIIRTSIIGEELYNKKSLLEWVKSNKNKTINGFTNHIWNGITCLTLAKIINKIIDENLFWTGIKHIYSPNSVSKYELCKIINKIYNLNINVIPINDKKYKNMTLLDNHNFIVDDIEQQIIDLHDFGIHFFSCD